MDSRGHWRVGNPLSEVESGVILCCRYLTHPIWWGTRHLASEARLRIFISKSIHSMSAIEADRFRATIAETLPNAPRMP